MKVLFAVWELDPFLKVGGLGDVARSLPAALKEKGIDIRTVIPYYKAVKLGGSKRTKIRQFTLEYAKRCEKVEIFCVFHPLKKVPVYLLHNKRYLSTPAFPDTFAFFAKAIVAALEKNHFSWLPDIIHCNDLHTSLIPLLLKEKQLSIKTMLTIHNLSYQGKTSIDIIKKLGLGENKCRLTEWEIKSRKVNFLLEGISHADVVTTVSDTYAKEILTEELGESLDRVLEDKKDHLFGILNGIDIDWIDNLYKNAVSYPYVKTNAWEEGKRLNKLHLQKELGLLVKSGVPLFSFIGRFDPHQKGIDILHKMLKRISHTKYEFVILGTGDVNWEERFQWLGKFFPKNISCHFRFDEVLAHKIYAASDFILIPSRFEPCGLIQMIAMYFGTLPIAHKTGGLSDSIKDGYNGFLFKRYTCEALRKTVEAAVDIWQNDKPRYRKMVENALSADFSWKKSAGKYLELYNKLIKESL